MYQRPIYNKIFKRLKEPRKRIQVLAGPRQVGKTTMALHLIDEIGVPCHYASADVLTLQDAQWIEQQWEIARLRITSESNSGEAILILDEVQKIPNWSTIVKGLWDQDTKNGISLKVVLLGSSTLLIQQGLSESMAGRFEIIHIAPWFYEEMRDAFDWSLEQYIFFGGYPGSAALISDQERWSLYITDSLIETSISRDIMLMTRINNPALLRRLFSLGCAYSGQVLSFQKMLGQLQDAGNTTTLSHYLDLLFGAGLITGLHKFHTGQVNQKASSPKLQVLNNALISAQETYAFEDAQEDRSKWGRLVESAIGVHLINASRGTKIEISYWREGNTEVDFILSKGDEVIALEVKSSQRRTSLPGIAAFAKKYPVKRKLLVGGQGISIEEFLLTSPERWF